MSQILTDEEIATFEAHIGGYSNMRKYLDKFYYNNKSKLLEAFCDELIIDLGEAPTDSFSQQDINSRALRFMDSDAYEKFVGGLAPLDTCFDIPLDFRNFFNFLHAQLTDVEVIASGRWTAAYKSTAGETKIGGRIYKTLRKVFEKIIEHRDNGWHFINSHWYMPTYEEMLKRLETFRIEHSKITDAKTVSGHLYVSIHPLDFITMSDNNSGWASCVSWDRYRQRGSYGLAYGEYRMGTIEMMTSPYVVIAYIADPDDKSYQTFGHTWNNKKWRELFVVTPDWITGMRGYPFNYSAVEEQVLHFLHFMAFGMYGDKYNEEIYETNPETGDQPMCFNTTVMYNDTCSNPIRYMGPKGTAYRDKYDIGGPVYCLECQKNPIYAEQDCEVCTCCNDEVYCDHCDDRVPVSEAYYDEETDSWYCLDCYACLYPEDKN